MIGRRACEKERRPSFCGGCAVELPSVTCCFTGHRELPAPRLPRLRALLDAAVEAAAQAGYTAFISGAARGFDLLAAEAVLSAKARRPELRLILALPCPDQTRGWPEADLRRWRAIVDACDESLCLSPFYTPQCMLFRDRWMVDHSARCICYMTRFQGGTGFTVRCALERELEMVNLALRMDA